MPVVASVLQWLHRNSFKGHLVLAVFHELRQHLVPVQVNELLGDHFIPKLLFQHSGVGLSHSKGNCAADISKHGLADGQGELIDILMRQDEAKTVFAGFGQQGSKSIGGKILEFINEEEKVTAFFFRLGGAGHRRQLELRHKE